MLIYLNSLSSETAAPSSSPLLGRPLQLAAPLRPAASGCVRLRPPASGCDPLPSLALGPSDVCVDAQVPHKHVVPGFSGEDQPPFPTFPPFFQSFLLTNVRFLFLLSPKIEV